MIPISALIGCLASSSVAPIIPCPDQMPRHLTLTYGHMTIGVDMESIKLTPRSSEVILVT